MYVYGDSYTDSQVSFPAPSMSRVSPVLLTSNSSKVNLCAWTFTQLITGHLSKVLHYATTRVLQNLQRGVISSFSTKSACRTLYTGFVRDLMCLNSTSSNCGVRRNRCMLTILRSSLMSAVDLTAGLVASSSSL